MFCVCAQFLAKNEFWGNEFSSNFLEFQFFVRTHSFETNFASICVSFRVYKQKPHEFLFIGQVGCGVGNTVFPILKTNK